MGLGAAAASLALAGCGGNAQPGAVTAQATGEPRRGGILRIGLTGGGASDTLDANAPVGTADGGRVMNLYDRLYDYSPEYELVPRLAESATSQDGGRAWVFRLRKGVTFHDGRPLTSKEVVSTFKRITDPKDPKTGAAGLALLKRTVAVDEHTVRFELAEPDAMFVDSTAQNSMGIVPTDYDPKKPVGTGAFRLGEFEPGQLTVLKANPDYWDGKPYLDEVHLLNFNDQDALVNALLSTQVDVVGQLPLAMIDVVNTDPRLHTVVSQTGNWLPFTMRVDTAPFDDPRVREAFRLVVDREQMVEQVFSGHGTVGNDMYAPFDPGTPELPQRTRDIAKAKKLLAAAGHPDGLEVELVTAPIQSGAVEAAQVFAEQASEAGIRVKLRRVDATTFFGDGYLKYPFAQDFWYTRSFLPQSSMGSLPKAPFNETHWADPEFLALYKKARATLDEKKRNELVARAQQLLHDKGGYIAWGFFDQADAYQNYVGGAFTHRSGMPVSGFQLRSLWIAPEGK
ncbi:ABC transporter substrate-binding protein [Kocuria tytonis]|uniref:ABC transporter substrate-binding protein n=2 Tax=Kocuria tytonis TaxID=2054280 RepID=A0A495A308_9MICC|nr:ABC transporter substrate-binding protein [Kocuria tytonis]